MPERLREGAFETFVTRKEADARAARLDPWTTDVHAHGDGLTAIGNAWSRALFDGDFRVSPAPNDELPSTSLVFVQSRDGNTGASDPSTLGGGETDKHLIYEGLSRVAADAVMAGAETIRDGRIMFSVWHPELVRLRLSLGLPRHPIQVVATLRGLNLADGLLFNIPDVPVVVITVASCDAQLHRAVAERPWIRTIVMDRPDDLQRAFARLRQLGVRRMSCVGGRTLARQLLEAGVIQDVYLTTSAQDGGEPGTPLSPRAFDGTVVLRKRGTGADAGVSFEHRTLARLS